MLNCTIIDDEPLAVEVIKDFIEKVPFIRLKSTYTNALEALQHVNDKETDLLFLDIRMPDISGIDFVRSLQQKPAAVIFTTAYQEYALESYNLNVLDYLLKPIPFNRFLSAVTRAHEYVSALKGGRREEPAAKKFIFIKTEYKIVKIELDDILYIEGLKDYSKIYLKDNPKPIFTLQNLKSFEAKFPPEQFTRIHRSYIVSVNKINVICKNRVVIGQTDIPISIGFKNNIQEIIHKNS
ncbi:LytR/AlgR family response regulator transcription factor [Deminuibacter soli]|uniref:DNA-binding response regulator n=1 Tax=Deminuibacter soli TaxID=2291815 RepID=A0A3E1NRU9_9BACT|nr:LytTR family DNA-binding domain-containing protein [Deminuibacter soli]RFM30488.1 DNA-binding response regulator [Deminuibacter soli]